MKIKIHRIGLIVLLSLGTLFFIMTLSTVTAEEEQEVPEEISIDSKGYKNDRKGPVPLSHLDHAESYDVACSECHHEYEDGKNVWEEGDPVKKCGECHSPLKSEGKIKKLSIAFHKNCKGCHKKLAREEGGTEAPYKKCSDCHEKKG
jgi:hypothetical protein